MNAWTWTVLQLMTDSAILADQREMDKMMEFIATSLCKD